MSFKVGFPVLVISVVVVLAVLVVVSPSLQETHHGEGYKDPATAIHITSSGEITQPLFDLSSPNITHSGDTYKLTANVSNWVIIEKSNIVLDGCGFFFNGSHGLSLSGVSNVTVKNLGIYTHYIHILMQQADGCTIKNVTSSITMRESNHNLISNCTCIIDLEQSNENTVKNCATGKLALSQSNGNSFLYNTIWTQGPSIGLWKSSNNLIFGNTFEKFWWWISLSGDNNKIVANNVWAGQIYTEDKIDGTNYIYHNNFYNFHWDHSIASNSANVWSSDGRGNYYANYSGGDADGDGVGDAPYVIDKTNTDEYPLMTPVDISSEPLP